MYFLKIPESFSSFTQRVTPIDDGHDLSGFKEFFYEDQILLVLPQRGDMNFLARGLGNSLLVTRRLEELKQRSANDDVGPFRF